MNYSPHNSCALYVNNPESICYKPECRSSGQCERTKPDPKDARIAELEEALRRIDVGLTRAIDANNPLTLDDMATQARDLARALTGEHHD
jgi:hypothetical protein